MKTWHYVLLGVALVVALAEPTPLGEILFVAILGYLGLKKLA